MLMGLWVEILCKQKITENSCVKHPPSHLVGLLTKPREPSSLQACPSTAGFGSSRSSPFHPHLVRLLSLHNNSSVVSHLHLTHTACPSPPIKHSGVSQAASGVIFERAGSRLCPSVWPQVHFPFTYLPLGNESPPTAFLASFFR